ncbi:MAG: DUF1538 domain-containing protein [Lachnospiraceae bacterium]|nr:DUF1538 domain-containing protein [Lachnospiraceae bacterium]
MYTNRLRDKLLESIQAVGPIVLIVLVLSLTLAPLPSGILLSFLLGSLLLIIGEMFFSLGAELAMGPMGGRMGAGITKTKKLPLILTVSFIMGFLITIAEPDLQVLAEHVQSVPNAVLIVSVAVGVGLFLLIAFLRMILQISLRLLLTGFYVLIFLLVLFVPSDFLAVSFDAGGVTTGPMTVPFIMAFGVGISSIRSDRTASDDSLGLVALCSIGPILTVLILGIIYRPEDSAFTANLIADVQETTELGRMFAKGLPVYLWEMAKSLFPMVFLFGLFQIFLIKVEKHKLGQIAVGIVYTYLGLVLFLTGANVGFMPAGLFLGQTMANLPYYPILIPIGILIGYFIVKAEPAVYVLMRQVEDLTDGAVSGKVLQRCLCLGVAVSIGLSMIRVLCSLSLLWIIIPGYALAIGLSFFTPKIFTAIAFDSGGVASGPMTATFLLPLAMGVCFARGGEVITDAFGVVALVALTPLITIQILGLIYTKRRRSSFTEPGFLPSLFEELPEDAIIEL